MISGASEQELELANARANIVMKLDNTSTYESWLIIDTYLERLEKENQELKKQLEECKNLLDKGLFNASFPYRTGFDKGYKAGKETQQKEFVKYLEDKINFYKINTQGYSMGLVEEVLQKYKEIIGDDK